MTEVYIVAAKRSPVGKYLGELSKVSLVDLSTQTLTKTLTTSGIDPSIINHFIFGNVLGHGNKQGPARQIAVNSGIDIHTPAYAINMICGSGMKAIIQAYGQIKLDWDNSVAVVGAESMSTIPFILGSNLRLGHKMGDFKTIDPLVDDALTDAFTGIHMGITAENIVRKYDLTRQEQDKFALQSHHKAVSAIKSGAFVNEIVPISIKDRKGITVVDHDSGPRDSIDIESLTRLKPVFEKDGTVTAGNASSLNDGAAALVLANSQTVQNKGLKPLVRIIGIGQDGIDPPIMGLGPIGAIKKALIHANLTLDQIDIIELNEAFAAQSLGVVKGLSQDLGVSPESILSKTNLNGGAIAIGHPLGASGARIVVTLIHLLKKHQKKYGLASLCIGGGMGIALIVENID